MAYVRICDCCGKYFKTDKRHAKVCDICKEKNHKNKIKRTLNLL